MQSVLPCRIPLASFIKSKCMRGLATIQHLCIIDVLIYTTCTDKHRCIYLLLCNAQRINMENSECQSTLIPLVIASDSLVAHLFVCYMYGCMYHIIRMCYAIVACLALLRKDNLFIKDSDDHSWFCSSSN